MSTRPTNSYLLQNIRQTFAQRTVLAIDHLELTAGRSYALLGPNGSGKSTLLRLLALLQPPTSGQLFFQDRPVNWQSRELTALRRRVVLVDQHPIMFTTSVIKNVEYGLRLRGVTGSQRRRQALECLARVGMEQFAEAQAHRLSGGETQRVAIARALACRPEVMLFDEPTASIDLPNRMVVEQLMADIQRELGLTIIFASHDRLQANRLGDEKIVLFEGRPAPDSSWENQFPGQLLPDEQPPQCRIGHPAPITLTLSPTALAAPATGQGTGPAVMVRIDPTAIRLAPPNTNGPGTAPAPNRLPARVLQMSSEDEQIRVLLDAGFALTALVTREEISAAGLTVGDRLEVVIDPGGIELLGGY
ncbi:ABC transporter ATP-binding protein [Desulfurivibrio alkaliphilus]|uniref:ABC transporter related protein n=1 Tax=Desulfurivibrio alkaliphilus (strain DSM 19089 / UNIQEM U267 / AHT2) TaxID=589865 RepID=D6Z130_DESAT|nr:ATP-binding cassette domain-containing protein [Desulfurivibrio alkaliphilus]ADH87290.1 ABC transporter related protein [Desulfurivibrio alkaliphilus AHT 2]